MRMRVARSRDGAAIAKFVDGTVDDTTKLVYTDEHTWNATASIGARFRVFCSP